MKEFLNDINIEPNTTTRMDCPICHNHNTFSVHNNGSVLLYNCFHIDCNIKGVAREKLSKESFTRKKFVKKEEDDIFITPTNWNDARFSVDCLNYLTKSNSYLAYYNKYVDIKYDKNLARCVFLIKDEEGNVVDGVGRSLNGIKPKWYRYGNSKYPFVCGDKKTAIIVEDCASACAVSKYATGIALLGTNLLQKHIDIIKKYDKVGVALDRDATKKATKICDELNLIMNTKFLVLEDDIKNMADEDIEILVNKVNKKAWGWMNDTVTSNKHL